MSDYKDPNQYFKANKELWNNKTVVHLDSEFYDNASFLAGRNSLNEIELEYLQDIKGKRILHIQCHFGQDSISLARLGAQVTGTDISDVALKAARRFNKECDTDVTFIETDTYSLDSAVDGEFDLIFLSYGVTCWLPDIHRLAELIDGKLAPDGRVLMVEFHPMLMTFNFDTNNIEYGYRNEGVYEEVIQGSYVESNQFDKRENPLGREYFWQHSLEELMMPFLKKGLTTTAFREYYYSPYNIFETMEEKETGKYVFGNFKYPIPHVYLMEFTKKGSVETRI